jgi:hypothetical protein
MTITKQKIETNINEINKHYQIMQKKVLEIMVHPDATQRDVENARQLLIKTAQALAEAQDNFLKAGYTIVKLEGIKKLKY